MGQHQVKSCRCRKCLAILDKTDTTIQPLPFPRASMEFVVCSVCGNKRCPHASDHNLKCTGSNEPGQHGSVYGVFP